MPPSHRRRSADWMSMTSPAFSAVKRPMRRAPKGSMRGSAVRPDSVRALRHQPLKVGGSPSKNLFLDLFLSRADSRCGAIGKSSGRINFMVLDPTTLNP
jgi:hypothetical protein